MAIRSTSPLSGLLRKSPFKPLQEHMQQVHSCVCLLPSLFQALYREDQEAIDRLAREIDATETKADKMKSEFRLHMPTTLFLPVDRRDLLTLLRDQDFLADTTEKIAQILSSRRMEVPDGIRPLLDRLLEATVEISGKARQIVEELDELVQVGFGGREYDKVITMIASLRSGEHDIDRQLHQLRKTLFGLEDTLPPVTVMFWYQVIELLGEISNGAENISDRLLLFLSK